MHREEWGCSMCMDGDFIKVEKISMGDMWIGVKGYI